ncbi:midasin [Violaceomyces palustris]|uniref:Midasin n=1 Tax=Violaceomyces palustris TaxID=1673888 RepID=A0ACD0NS92_9BASI|nr:midasin [Violaceomyces palustris]
MASPDRRPPGKSRIQTVVTTNTSSQRATPLRLLPSVFQFDLATNIRHFLDSLQSIHPETQWLQHYAEAAPPPNDTHASHQDLLSRLSELLLLPRYTDKVAIHFRPLLVDLTARLLDLQSSRPTPWHHPRTLATFSALTRLLSPFEEIYSILYQYLSHPSLDRGPLADSPERIANDSLELRSVLLAIYRLAQAAPGLLSNLSTPWPSERLHHIFSRPQNYSAGTRLLALQTFALQERLSEATKLELVANWLGTPPSLETLPSEHDVAPGGIQATVEVVFSGFEEETLDVWILPLAEKRRVSALQRASASTQVGYFQAEQGGDHPPSPASLLRSTDLSPRTCAVGGVLLARSSGSASPEPTTSGAGDFVETPGSFATMTELALRISCRLPVLLSGPPACGKTHLLSHLVNLVHPSSSHSKRLVLGGSRPSRNILTIQLGDQSGVDAKQLIGSFVSSPTNPGTFEWSEGALTRAVRLGMWVVLEDIDKAGGEVLSTIGRLVEDLGPTKPIGAKPSLDLGSRGKVVAGDGFALFATRSTPAGAHAKSPAAAFPKPAFLGNEHWSEVRMQAPTRGDVHAILSQSFPRLSSTKDDRFLSRLISTWEKLCDATTGVSRGASKKDVAAGAHRAATLRDLIKWCRRVQNLLGSASVQRSDPFANPVQQEEIFIESCDVFLGSSPPPLSEATAAPSSSEARSVAAGKAADRYSALVELLAEELGLSSERAWWALKGRKPELALRTSDSSDGTARASTIQIGRCELPRAPPSARGKAASPISKKFALTRPTLGLLERLAVSVALAEPVLLVGETGTGKTTVVQHLASLLGRPMTALNLSQQTESGDLLGAFKPLDPKIPATELHNAWIDLFSRTFSARRNARFVDAERKAFLQGKWARLCGLWRESARLAASRKRAAASTSHDADEGNPTASETTVLAQEKDGQPKAATRKKRRTENGSAQGSPAMEDQEADAKLDAEWAELERKAREFGVQHGSKKRSLVFSFVEGPLVKALRSGDWVLLDEVNLAAAETLDCLSGLLQSPDSSVTLTERGDLEPIPRHPDFRLFACMNPATDVGKKDLPSGLRSRFTELYVPSPDSDRDALVSIVEKYIGEQAVGDRGAVMDVAECYTEMRRLAQQHELADGANQRPHYSIRTLSRALTFATDIAPTFGLRRGLWEGLVMAFTMLLDTKSSELVRGVIESKILARARNARQIARFVPPAPPGSEQGKHVQIGPFWIETGPLSPDAAEDYVLTPSVQDKLIGLSRAALTRRFPVLIQGPTSAGKTSAVEYLARRTGHRFVRINNHEHTDIQEYLGSYASDPETGRLVFHEGLLVRALRQGDWIVLDELNLAPTDVLEALNRLLDDNRELVIPETGEVVRPHPHFMLFATQNPPGLYAGRKVLSRAFRNRFLELHFDDVPRPELETILTNRCAIPPSYASKIVAVFVELQKRRQAGRVFETKQAFVTLRDLFRWGTRAAIGYQHLAENGYMLIAERARRSDDRLVVKEVIEQVMRVKIDERAIYDLHGQGAAAVSERIGHEVTRSMLEAVASSRIVWTDAVQRLLCLVATALRYNEPVLLVGETGAGKTSVCEVLATAFGRQLHSVNLHQNTDTADLIGGQRPLRNRAAIQAAAKSEALTVLDQAFRHGMNVEASLEDVAAALGQVLSKWPAEQAEVNGLTKARVQDALHKINQSTALFEWHDGPLVEAMRSGDHLLLDEISLADDSVLERLNSVLEPGRTLVLAERSTSSSSDKGGGLSSAQIRGSEGFQVLATMNPGGDYGKKELSPALRNRFTEIWVPHIDARSDLVKILNAQWKHESLERWSGPLLDFADWFVGQVGGIDQAGLGLRDLLGWVAFMNQVAVGPGAVLAGHQAFAHGAYLAIIDGLGALPATAAMSAGGLAELRRKCHSKLLSLIRPEEFDPLAEANFVVKDDDVSFGVGPFTIPKGPIPVQQGKSGDSFSFGAPTSASNAMRVLRALSVPNKALLLEGSPGAGKTSLISALAKASSNPLTRINLSDQTELVDLFGADLPVEGGGPGEFSWKDAAFLTAMQKGEWVLLDEMNLASQSVLEGLNSCLDHRGTVFLPELGRSFTKHPDFRLFAAQNPHHQGGGRKGLPKSFLNRFTKVHIQELCPEDILEICAHLFPTFSVDDLGRMIDFNARLHQETMVRHSFGRVGAPWEFNLRDLLRWLNLLHTNLGMDADRNPLEHLASLYILRFRTSADRKAAAALFEQVFGVEPRLSVRPWPSITPDFVQLGHSLLPRGTRRRQDVSLDLALLQHQLPTLEALADCLQMRWLGILTGPSGSGKTSVVRLLAQLAGARLEEFRMSSGTDTMDLLGTFEQYDPQARLRETLSKVDEIIEGLMEKCGRIDSDSYQHLSATHRALAQELGDLAKHKDHSVDGETLRALLSRFDGSVGLPDADRSTLKLASEVLSPEALAEGRQAGSGRFEWVDGPLLRALKEGHWLLLDNANLCSASVLDRLNSLFEPDGSLIISERGVVDGEVPVIRPHPSFRVFMALDARHGELSRAMRNRGIEISMILEKPTSADTLSTNDSLRLSHLARCEFVSEAHEPGVSLAQKSVEAQAVRRAMKVGTIPQPGEGGAGFEAELQWAAGIQGLKDSSLASVVLNSSSGKLREGEEEVDDLEACLIHAVSATSVKHFSLLPHLRIEAVASVTPFSDAGRAFTSSPFVRSICASRTSLDKGERNIEKAFLESQALDLRYNPNLRAPPSAHLLETAKRIELTARSLFQQASLRTVTGQARKKAKTSLSVLEQSALSRSDLESLNADQAGPESEDGAIQRIYPLLAAFSLATLELVRDESVGQVGLEQLEQLLDSCSFLEKTCSTSLDLDYSSVQIVVQIMEETMANLVKLGVVGLPASLGEAVAALGGKISLTSGLAMQEIWDLHLSSHRDAEAAEIARQISGVLSRLPRRSVGEAAVMNALDVTATLTLSQESWSKQDRDGILDLGRKTVDWLSAIEKKSTSLELVEMTPDESREALILSGAELALESMIKGGGIGGEVGRRQVGTARLKSFVDLVCQAKVTPAHVAISARRTMWSLEAGVDKPHSDEDQDPSLSMEWSSRLWDQSKVSRLNSHCGPAELLRPMVLKAVMDSRNARVSLKERLDQQAAARRLIHGAGLAFLSTSPSRLDQMRSLLANFIHQLSLALERAIQRTAGEEVTATVLAGERKTVSVEQALSHFDSVARSEMPAEARRIASEWSACLEGIQVTGARGGQEFIALGEAWIKLAVATMALYLPNVAIDPVVTEHTRGSLAAHRRGRADARLRVEVEAEAAITGNESNQVIEHIRSELGKINLVASRRTTKNLGRQPNLKLLTQLHREVHSFVVQVLAKKKLEDLVSAIKYSFDQQTEDRESSLQASISGFAHRLRLSYAALHDLTAPFHVVLDQIQLGLRIMVQGARFSARGNDAIRHSKILDAMVSFPTLASTCRYSDLDLPIKVKATSKSSVLTSPLLIATVSSAAVDAARLGTGSMERPTALQRISRTYDQLHQLWILDREREKQAEEEASSLYKSKKLDEEMQMEADAEEKEFRQLFPEYADVLDESGAKGKDDQEAAMAKTGSVPILVKPQHVTQLYKLHLSLFGQHDEKKQGVEEPAASADAIWNEGRSELVKRILDLHYSTLHEDTDRRSAAYQVNSIASLAGVETSGSGRSAKLNFYLDAHPEEVSKAIPIVQRLIDRLNQIIREWPEQMVLQHIRDRCEAILRLEASSPVAKILSALEQLLMHTEDWQGYASSATSLTVNREEISRQIVEWRRLELSCWARLLEAQSATFQDGLAEWWFRLFEILIRSTRAAFAEGVDQGESKDHIRKLIDSLDQFIRSSSLGQYAARLRLLDSYASYLELLVLKAPARDTRGLAEVSVVLRNVTTFFSQFNAKVATALGQQRELLEKEIRNFIKLASWKDINVHALKQSAQKTHRQLHKCIRKFRDVLRQPADPLLAATLEGISRKELPTSASASFQHVPRTIDPDVWSAACAADGGSEDVAVAPHIAKLAQTHTMLRQMREKHLVPDLLLEDGAGLGLSELAEEIVDRSQQLAKLTPQFSNEDNEKAIKNLTSRKRKAWTDLLKELRRIGLSSFLKSDVASRNQDGAYVYTQSPLVLPDNSSDVGSELLESVERFHFRLLASLPRLRDSLHSHHADLSTSDLQRGVNYVEHCMSLVFAERARLSRLVRSHRRLEALVSRISDVHRSTEPSVVPVGADVPARISALSDTLGRLEASLFEISSSSPRFVQLSPLGDHGCAPALEAVEKAKARCRPLRKGMRRLASEAGRLLTTDEVGLISKSLEWLKECLDSLREHHRSAPALSPLVQPTTKWLADQTDSFEGLLEELEEESKGVAEVVVDASSLRQQADRIVSSVLVIAQELRRDARDVGAEGGEDGGDSLPDKAVTEGLSKLASTRTKLRVEAILEQVEELLDLSSRASKDEATRKAIFTNLVRVSPFLDEYLCLVKAHSTSSASWTQSMLKLSQVLCNLVASLAQKGFCKPPVEEQGKGEEGDGQDGEQLEGGTGLGDGTGAKDVTDEMEDDEPMEELRKEEGEKEDGEKEEVEGERNAREAEQDFGGELEDVDQGDEDEEEGEGEEEKDEEEKEIDDHVGDVDPLDPNAVDEKMWNGDEEKEEKEDVKDTADQGGEGQEDESSESAPKNDEKQNKESDSKGSKEKAGEKGDDHGEDRGEEEEGAEDQDGDEKDGSGSEAEGGEEDGEEGREEEEMGEEKEGLGRKLDEQVQEGENLDLNDDINMDMDGDEQKEGDDDDDGIDLSDDAEDLGEEEEKDRKEDEIQADEPAREEVEKDHGDNDVDPEANEAEDQVEKNEGEEAMDEEDQEGDGEEEGDEDKDGGAKTEKGEEVGNDQNDASDPSAANDAGMDQGADEASAQQKQSTRGQQGRRVEAQNSSAQADQGEQDEEDQGVAQPVDEQASGGSDSRSRRPQPSSKSEEAQKKEEEQDDATNPVRSLGDALEEFRRKFDEIQEAATATAEEEEKSKPDGEGPMDQGDDVEHVANDEDAEMQALGGAEEDEVQKLGELALEEEEEEELGSRPRGEDVMDQLEAKQELGSMQIPEEPDQEERSQSQGQQKAAALMPSDIQPGDRSKEEQEAPQGGDGGEMSDEHVEEDDDMTPIPEDERLDADHDIEQKLNDYRAAEDEEERLSKAGDLWRSYKALTADLAFSLCEQLRLILAPTLATRLNGDFRTGKRLNMRKIVPFIASDFAKDKIWLRRTKPSAREYQVLVAVDDSKSMAESRSSHLAYQTLSLVSGALERLEVGEVGLCRFGEDFEVLHELGGSSNLGDDKGAGVIHKLSFQQKGTNVLRLVEKSLEMLQRAREARSSSSSPELWQLEIIISDGICQDHERLRALLRKAAEQRVMMVFVIIDSLPSSSTSSSSILSMNSVRYETDPKTGKLEIHMERYLDTFPFEFFIVLRDVEALPHVLSATLRQWAEKIREAD